MQHDPQETHDHETAERPAGPTPEQRRALIEATLFKYSGVLTEAQARRRAQALGR